MHGQGLKIMNIQPFYVFFLIVTKRCGGGGEGGELRPLSLTSYVVPDDYQVESLPTRDIEDT